jgi:hypothetical protein
MQVKPDRCTCTVFGKLIDMFFLSCSGGWLSQLHKRRKCKHSSDAATRTNLTDNSSAGDQSGPVHTGGSGPFVKWACALVKRGAGLWSPRLHA